MEAIRNVLHLGTTEKAAPPKEPTSEELNSKYHSGFLSTGIY